MLFLKEYQENNPEFVKSFKHFINYFGGSVAGKAAAIIALPVFTRLLTTEDYGLFSVYTSYVGILSVIVILNSHVGISRYYFDEQDDFPEYLGTSILFSATLLLIGMVTFWVFRQFWRNLLGLPLGLIFPLYITIFINTIFSFYGQLKKSMQNSGEFALINLIKICLGISLSIVLILNLSTEKYLGRVWGSIVVGLFLLLYIVPMLIKHARIAVKKKHILFTIKYCAPLIPGTLSGVILAQFDRIMIFNYSGASDAGLYSVAYSVGMLLMLVVSSSRTAINPEWFKKMNKKQYRKANLLSIQYFCFSLMAALFLIYFGHEMLVLLSDRSFHDAAPVIPIVVIGYTFFSMDHVYRKYIGYSKKTVYISLIMLTCGAVNIVLNAVFIPKFGYIAAAYTTAASYLLMSLLSWIVSKYLLKMPVIPLSNMLKPLLIFIVFTGFYYCILQIDMNMWIKVCLKLLVFLFFVSILFHCFLQTYKLNSPRLLKNNFIRKNFKWPGKHN